MRRTIFCLLVILLVVSIGLVSCAKPAPTPTPAPKPAVPAPTPAPAPKPAPAGTKVTMAGPPVGWTSYAVAIGWAQIVNKYSSPLVLVVESTPGTPAKLEALVRGQSNLASQSSYNVITFVYNGEQTYAGKPWTPAKNVRLLIGGLETLKGAYMTSTRTGVKTYADLKGKAIPKYAQHSMDPQCDALLKIYGIDRQKNVKEIFVNESTAAWQELQMGRLDVVWDSVSERQFEWQEALGQLVFLNIDQAKFDEAKAKYPDIFLGVYLDTLMPGDIAGLKMSGPTNVIAYLMMAIANTDLPDNVAYTIVKTLLEHPKEVQAITSSARSFSAKIALPPVSVASVVPYHPGAVKAYKELGLWTPEHEKMQQAALALLK